MFIRFIVSVIAVNKNVNLAMAFLMVTIMMVRTNNLPFTVSDFDGERRRWELERVLTSAVPPATTREPVCYKCIQCQGVRVCSILVWFLNNVHGI